jgi:diguanylate cyclase (GGDEF)-like protein
LKTFVRPASFGAGVSLVTGSIGLLAVTAMYANSSSAALLIVIAIVLAGSIRSYAKLQERHASLGQLYAIQEQLGTLVPQAKSLFPVLEQARSLLQAERVVLTLLSDDGTQRVLSVHVDEGPSEAYEARTSEQLALTPPEALSVELRIQQARLGLLAVHGRLGRIRGFDRSDLKLLETLGAHVSDALERGTLVEKLREAATHDALTGLLTLGELMVQVDERLLRDTSLFVCLLDVSGLRDVNDSLGHEAGDALLRTLATRLTDALPPDALIARSGGGEFAVALREGDAYSSLSYVETLAEVSNGLVQVLDVTVELRTRCGWLLLPTDAADASTAIRRADLALAEAKRGLHPAARYRAELDVDGGRRLRLVSDLRRAIADRSLHVVYQPLVTPRDGRIIGAEALVRWNHPDLGPLSPDEFVGIAEHSGLIGDMTRLVLDEALAQVRQWHLRGQDVRVAVNLSARCLTDMSLPGAILDLLAHHRVAADHLTLEVTETSVAEEPVRALAVLERLRGIGVRLSIDDFGTGYSSLASLKRFPVQEVKLDRQFLLDVGEAGPVSGKSDWALIAAIVALGHSLDLEIVAEGVEDAGTYERLRDMGVDVLQGYYIGRPAPGVILPVALAPVMS